MQQKKVSLPWLLVLHPRTYLSSYSYNTFLNRWFIEFGYLLDKIQDHLLERKKNSVCSFVVVVLWNTNSNLVYEVLNGKPFNDSNTPNSFLQHQRKCKNCFQKIYRLPIKFRDCDYFNSLHFVTTCVKVLVVGSESPLVYGCSFRYSALPYTTKKYMVSSFWSM